MRMTPSSTSVSETPWHQPGRWLANPAYWTDDALAQRTAAPTTARFIDCTLSEGDDCVGHQASWSSRLGLIERLSDAGVDEITLPSHTRIDEELDLIKACERLGITTPLVAKGPGLELPLRGDWKEILRRHAGMGAQVICPIYKWPFEHTLTDFDGDLSKAQIVEELAESAAFSKTLGVRVVPWIGDAMRTKLDTVASFFGALSTAGVDGVYVVDSRGNSNPVATRVFVGAVRAEVGPDCDIYVQHHNDIGMATANALAALEAGATVTDASVLGIGDRGGCVALEEAAVIFEMYGYATNIRLDKLYELGLYTQQAFGVDLAPWKPIIGENWNKEEGSGHLEGDSQELATIGVAPSVIGRAFEGVIGAKLLFGRERSSSWSSEPQYLRDLLQEWEMPTTEEQFERILTRTRQAVATSHDKKYLTINEFRAIAEGASLGGELHA
jgi:isopropylmalate/homocitrate/citramalate synthase